MLKRGMCAAYTLNNPRVIRLEPPLIIAEEQIEFAVHTMDEAVAAIREVQASYARHAKAARAIAESYFDSDKILTRLIESAAEG